MFGRNGDGMLDFSLVIVFWCVIFELCFGYFICVMNDVIIMFLVLVMGIG